MITVMVVDDQELMRTALEHFVSLAEDMQAVPGAADGAEAVEDDAAGGLEGRAFGHRGLLRVMRLRRG